MSGVDLLCFSHLRWDFVFQRPNHLMTRCAQERRVFFIEDPLYVPEGPFLQVESIAECLFRVIPHLSHSDASREPEAFAALLRSLYRQWQIDAPLHWYYSPMFLRATRDLSSQLTIYDCMDELSAFKGAPPELGIHEAELLAASDVVFTGGMALYEAKRSKHPYVFGVPSSVDVPHFARARADQRDPADQAAIPHPRIGYYGVIDERIDLLLLAELAQQRPDIQFVMLGPVVKIHPDTLPRRDNIHYLGPKAYDELPGYAAGWDIAFMPFALNEATRYISPTKTPEYLAAGRPVLSSAIRDVVEPYERLGLVRVGRSVPEFLAHIDELLAGHNEATCAERDAFLRDISWDLTWAKMREQIDHALARKQKAGSTLLRSAAE